MKKQYSFLAFLTEMSVSDLKCVKEKNINWLIKYLEAIKLPFTRQDAINVINSKPKHLQSMIQTGGMLSSRDPNIVSAGQKIIRNLCPGFLWKFRTFLF